MNSFTPATPTWSTRICRNTWIGLHNAPLFMKQPRLSVNYFDSQAFTSPTPNMNGFEFATLYTLQHRLARDAQFHRGLQHGQIPRRGLLHEASTQLIAQADAPGCARSDLFSGQESIVDPSMQGRGGQTQALGCLFQRHEIPGGRFRWRLAAWNMAITAQTTDLIGREALPARRSASLTVENASDDVIGVVHGQTMQQGDRIFVGVEAARLQ